MKRLFPFSLLVAPSALCYQVNNPLLCDSTEPAHHLSTYFLHISPDLLQASVHCLPGRTDDRALAPDLSLAEHLAQALIIHGLDTAAIERVEAARAQHLPLEKPLLVARGSAPRIGHRGLHPRHVPAHLLIEEEAGEGAEPVDLLLFPLVDTGEVLADPGPPSPAESGKNIFGVEISCPFPPEQLVVADQHARLDETTGQLLATTTGYPALRISRKGQSEQLHLGVDPLIKLTEDGMQALLCLKPAPPGEPMPDAQRITQWLDTLGIRFGRLPQAINQALERCSRDQQPCTELVALGRLPVKGRDAWLRFAMDIGPLPGKVMGNGDIDFRERNLFIGVNKDQVIAVRVPPTPGAAGCDVFGEEIAPVAGKDIAVRVTDDAAFDPENGEIRAVRAGVLSLVSDGAVKVCSRQVISQDIDFKTGNIVSRDALEIRGSVKPKFRVNALGDILIRGTIEKAQVRSDANIVAQTGMVGDYAVMHSRGDVDITYVERGRIFAGGSIVLRKSGYYCRLHAGGNITAAPTTRILASQVVAGGSLVLGTVGSDNAEPALVAAAVAPAQLQKMYTLRREVAAHLEALEKLRRRLGYETENEEIDELRQEYEESEKNLQQLNLITAETSTSSDQGLSHALECTITVKGSIYVGTEIRLGNSRMLLPSTMNNVCFRLREHIAPGAASRDILILANKK